MSESRRYKEKCPVCSAFRKARSKADFDKGFYLCRCNSVEYDTAIKFRSEHPVEEGLELGPEEVVRFTIAGHPAIKKNSPRIIKLGKFYSIRCSELYEFWASRALFQLREQWRELGRLAISGNVWMEAHYYRGRLGRCDLSNLHEGVQDCMQTVGILVDDDNILSHDRSRKHYDKDNPRIEIFLRRYSE